MWSCSADVMLWSLAHKEFGNTVALSNFETPPMKHAERLYVVRSRKYKMRDVGLGPVLKVAFYKFTTFSSICDVLVLASKALSSIQIFIDEFMAYFIIPT